jgi:hypothetical protein
MKRMSMVVLAVALIGCGSSSPDNRCSGLDMVPQYNVCVAQSNHVLLPTHNNATGDVCAVCQDFTGCSPDAVYCVDSHGCYDPACI